jgi:hypothetical protein
MNAFADAPTRKLKLQILSIYVYQYPTSPLIKLHEPYGGVSKWQIKQTRAHAKLNVPGSMSETIFSTGGLTYCAQQIKRMESRTHFSISITTLFK